MQLSSPAACLAATCLALFIYSAFIYLMSSHVPGYRCIAEQIFAMQLAVCATNTQHTTQNTPCTPVSATCRRAGRVRAVHHSAAGLRKGAAHEHGSGGRRDSLQAGTVRGRGSQAAVRHAISRAGSAACMQMMPASWHGEGRASQAIRRAVSQAGSAAWGEGGGRGGQTGRG